MSRLCIDLCSGLGGFSQAFVDAGWDVVRIDIDRKFRPTIQADVQNLPLKEWLQPDIILFSPPCQCFSVAALRYYWTKGRPLNGKTLKAIELVRNGLSALRRLAPKAWLMENPMGMLRKVIGRPRQTIFLSDFGTPYKKPTDIWGSFDIPTKMRHNKWDLAPRGSHNGLGLQGRHRDPAKRAKMPYGLSRAVLEAVSNA